MVIVIFGQPHSGKTTLAREVQAELFLERGISTPIIDGDDIRELFNNKDFSREGRLKNLNRISDIATFLNNKYYEVIVSAVYPIKEAREYLEELCKGQIVWVYLQYSDTRGRESFHVKDFDVPNEFEMSNLLILNTTTNGIKECVEEIRSFHRQVSEPSRRAQIPI
jgi:adenylate kinase family enzyme